MENFNLILVLEMEFQFLVKWLINSIQKNKIYYLTSWIEIRPSPSWSKSLERDHRVVLTCKLRSVIEKSLYPGLNIPQDSSIFIGSRNFPIFDMWMKNSTMLMPCSSSQLIERTNSSISVLRGYHYFSSARIGDSR